MLERIVLLPSVPLTHAFGSLVPFLPQRLVCPREVVWLNGAPGSGKGTNMPFIVKSRGLSRAVGMSQLLDTSPEIKVRLRMPAAVLMRP